MCNQKINFPSLKPVRMPTSGLPWYKQFSKYFESRKWRLGEDYVLYIPWLESSLLIPKGYVTDLASVPRIFWSLLPPTGVLLVGSIFHDFGYKYKCFIDKDYNVLFYDKDQSFFDEQIRKINIYVNGVQGPTDIAWGILRGFGWVSWYKHRKTNLDIAKDYPVKW